MSRCSVTAFSQEFLSLCQANVLNADELDGIRRTELSEQWCCEGCNVGSGSNALDQMTHGRVRNPRVRRARV
jgi:hypothetical protein